MIFPFAISTIPLNTVTIEVSPGPVYSFANWEDDIDVEFSSDQISYGPYTRQDYVFGIYFRQKANITIKNQGTRKSFFIIGYTNVTSETKEKSGYYEYKPETSFNFTSSFDTITSPIIYGSTPDIEKMVKPYIGIIITLIVFVIAAFVLFCKDNSDPVDRLFGFFLQYLN